MRRSRLSRQATQAHGEGGASAGAILAVLGCVVAGVAFFALRVETRQPGAGREADPRPPGTQAPRVEPRVDPPADQPPARPARPREVPAPPKPKAVDLDAPVSSVPGNAYAPDEAAVTEEAKRRFRANADRIGYSSTDSDEGSERDRESGPWRSSVGEFGGRLRRREARVREPPRLGSFSIGEPREGFGDVPGYTHDPERGLGRRQTRTNVVILPVANRRGGIPCAACDLGLGQPQSLPDALESLTPTRCSLRSRQWFLRFLFPFFFFP